MSDVISPTKKKKRTRSKKFENLIGPMDPKIDNLARERLITARIGLLLRHSFFGNLATAANTNAAQSTTTSGDLFANLTGK